MKQMSVHLRIMWLLMSHLKFSRRRISSLFARWQRSVN